MSAKWWEKAPEPTTVWRACLTDDGLDYYVNTETNETTWDKPEELMTEAELNSTGEWVWVPHETEAFVPALKVGKSGKKVDVELQDGSRRTVQEKDCRPFSKASLKRVVADLTLLDDMAAQLILHNLKKRFQKEEIYTNVGTILISVNPYKMLPLYSKEVEKRYVNKPMGTELPPHVFNVAHDAYYGVTSFKSLQSIVISGESGAGKTEATKRCLQYLASAAGSTSGIEQKILKANPILEAFGNAKTLRNDNSSRFGKYLEIYFNDINKICGSKTQNYLLEKIRVVQQTKGERNFHIFYQLVAAASDGLRKELMLEPKAAKYTYLSKCQEVQSIDDSKDFKEVRDAFDELSFTAEEQNGLFTIVAGVLALGNITFDEGRSDQSKCDDASEKWVEAASHTLGIDPKTLSVSMVTREIRVRGHEATKATLNLQQAADARHALAKFLYGRMFDWLVGRVNESMGKTPHGEQLYIGILDIFGFEIFKHNSFEQLCINFTNEMLQQHFNNNTFKLEEKVYVQEGIEFQHIDFIDNEPMIELITQKGSGILPILDEELIVPGGSDQGFMVKMIEQQERNPVFAQNSKSVVHFGVKHYAGLVEYDSTGFLEKNRDTLQLDIIEMLQASSNELVAALYPQDEVHSSKDRKSSLSRQFQKQLQDLMRQLYRTEPHYIRCIKPNETKAALDFVPQNCYEQLTYSGVFEAVAIRKQGYPFRLSHEEFAARYSKICDGEVGGSSKKAICEAIAKKIKLDPKNVKFGKTKVLYRAMEYRKMELEWEIRTKHETILANLSKLTRVDHESMDHEEKENYIIRLADAVRQADLFRIKNKDAEKGRNMLEIFVEERMDPKTKRDLQLAIESMDLNKLERVLEVCEREGYITKLVRACRELCEQIQDAEAALKMAVGEMNEEFMEKALQMCDDFGYRADSVNNARKLLKNVKKARSGIKKALVPPYKAEWTKKAVEYCISIQFTNFDGFVLCNTIRASIITARKMLTDGKDKKDQKLLESALNFSYDKKNFNGHKYKCGLEEECKELLVKVTSVNKGTIKATEECEENQVRAVVAEAAEIGMRNKAIDVLRKLVNGDYGKFLAEQFKKAKKCRHHARAIRVALKLKDREMEKKGTAMFTLERYTGLKDPMEWSNEKFTWSSVAKRAQNMLHWQEGHLHAPLTRASVQVGDVAGTARVINLFDTVQKAMTERNTLKFPFRLQEIIHDGVNNDLLRDEVYIFIMKQCSNNAQEMAGQSKPGFPSHIARAMELMALCLCYFPPSSQFVEYLEAFVRGEAALTHGARYNLKGLLQRRIYFGAAKPNELPTETEFAMGCQYNGKRYHDGAMAGVLNSVMKLSDFDEKKSNFKTTKDSKSKGSKKTKEKEKEKSKEKKKDKEKKPKQAKVAKESVTDTSDWQAATDPTTGKTYYYNSATKATSWTPPESMA
eukprot:m.143132 g.143132  ORF g.143132 m.143132 type:complete len:1427 (-) comp30293_c0_seq1:306-4586(-)